MQAVSIDIEALTMLAIATAAIQVIAHLIKSDKMRAPLTYCIGLGIILAGEAGYWLMTGDWTPVVVTAIFAFTNGAAVVAFYWRDHTSDKSAELEAAHREIRRLTVQLEEATRD